MEKIVERGLLYDFYGELLTSHQRSVYEEAVYMIPGWTHSIINLSETDNLVTVMTCNEIFCKDNPDTFYELIATLSSPIQL